MNEGDSEVAALEMMARAMVGLTMRSVDVLDGEVSLPQFRMLLVLSSLGRVPSSRLAAEMGTGASSVTRLADRLEAAGLLMRGTDPRSRSVVTLEATRAGVDLVARVVGRRHELLEAVLDQMTARERAEAVRVARRFAGLAGDAAALGSASPLPL
jgi:DNA-binding MarR family transcriptional regulator